MPPTRVVGWPIVERPGLRRLARARQHRERVELVRRHHPNASAVSPTDGLAGLAGSPSQRSGGTAGRPAATPRATSQRGGEPLELLLEEPDARSAKRLQTGRSGVGVGAALAVGAGLTGRRMSDTRQEIIALSERLDGYATADQAARDAAPTIILRSHASAADAGSRPAARTQHRGLDEVRGLDEGRPEAGPQPYARPPSRGAGRPGRVS